MKIKIDDLDLSLQTRSGTDAETINNYLYDLDEFFYSLHDELSYGIYEAKMYSAEIWTASNLRKQIDTLDKAIAEIQASNEKDELKQLFIDHVRLMKTSPLSLLLINYDIYYIGDTAGRKLQENSSRW